MPCRYDGPTYGEDGDGRAVKALCRVMKSLKVKWPAVRAEIMSRYPEVRNVVLEHEHEDRERVVSERRELERKRLKKVALKKLTAAERRALDL
jgi:hypothetical protein